jgi:hypothetical protein
LGKTWKRWVVYWTCTGTLPVIYGICHQNQGRAETVDFPPEKFTLPFPSAQDLATQAAAELTHALLHRQPAGLFCKVGDEQTIALKRLADIFEGTIRQKSKNVTPPHRKGGKCCTSEGATHSFTSEGGEHNGTTQTSSANHILTLNAKFSSQTTNPS